MSRRPLYHWKSFWLGILVIAFLGWSWMTSMRNPGGIGVAVPGVHGGAAYTNGSMVLFCNGSSEGFGIGFFNEPVEPESTWFPSGIESRFSEGKRIHLSTLVTLASGGIKKSWTCGYSPARGHIRIAHWLLILFLALLWTAFLFSRYRRMKRLPAGTTEPRSHRTVP
jgi:hypothetical protein